MKTWREIGGMTPFILYLCTRWRRGINFMHQPLCSWERTTRYSQNSTLIGSQSGSKGFGEGKGKLKGRDKREQNIDDNKRKERERTKRKVIK
jgi:hypothetical protein